MIDDTTCNYCGRVFPFDEIKSFDKRFTKETAICLPCLDEHYYCCDGCHEWRKVVDFKDEDRAGVCFTCIDKADK